MSSNVYRCTSANMYEVSQQGENVLEGLRGTTCQYKHGTPEVPRKSLNRHRRFVKLHKLQLIYSFRYKQYLYWKQMAKAATVIQNKYRTYCEHKRLKKSQEAAMCIQNYYRTYKEHQGQIKSSASRSSRESTPSSSGLKWVGPICKEFTQFKKEWLDGKRIRG